jgi:hypothetical protein
LWWHEVVVAPVQNYNDIIAVDRLLSLCFPHKPQRRPLGTLGDAASKHRLLGIHDPAHIARPEIAETPTTPTESRAFLILQRTFSAVINKDAAFGLAAESHPPVALRQTAIFRQKYRTGTRQIL